MLCVCSGSIQMLRHVACLQPDALPLWHIVMQQSTSDFHPQAVARGVTGTCPMVPQTGQCSFFSCALSLGMLLMHISFSGLAVPYERVDVSFSRPRTPSAVPRQPLNKSTCYANRLTATNQAGIVYCYLDTV